MKIIIQSPDVKAREKLLEFVNDKVEKLANLSDRLQEARVCLKTDNSDTKNNKICEIAIIIPGNDLFTAKNAKTFEEAVTRACDAAKRQITDWKLKTRPVAASNVDVKKDIKF